ncbi:MAG TPA: ABC transporter ATP-binding protein [Egibacteraceae bacterium]|nr:ABC transporter ATP-binding protein [Egibacteraceae bacterium]
MTQLSLRQVAVRYGDVVALDGLDLEIASGELLVLVGPSGSGKSTALRVIAGLQRPSAGRVLLGDRDVTDLPPHRRGVAMVFQDYALYPHLTVRENVAFGLRVRREPRSDERVADAARLLDLTDVLDRYPDQLSGGQQQRVALARAMVREPAVYLMDEPLSNLDAQLRLSARADIVELHRRLGTTTVYVTHDQAEAMTMGDRVAVVADGRLQQVGPPQQVYDEPANRFVAGFIGGPQMNFAEGGGLLGGDAGTVVGVRPEDLLIDPSGDVPLDVTVVESLGSETILAATANDGRRVSVRTGPRSPHRPGDRITVRVDPRRRHVFDASTGRRLP